MRKLHKQISLAILFSTFHTISFALPFNGFYVGAALGGNQGQFHFNQNFEVAPQRNNGGGFDIIMQNNNHISHISWLGDVALGIGHVFGQKFYIGVEGDAAFQHLKASSSFSVHSPQQPLHFMVASTTTMNNPLSLLLSPGLVLQKDSLLYGKIGPTWTQVKIKGQASFNESDDPSVTNSGATNFHDRHYDTGLLLALGIEHYVAQSISLKLEYDHVNYGTLHGNKPSIGNITTTDLANPLSGVVTYRDKISASTNAAMLGITYHIT